LAQRFKIYRSAADRWLALDLGNLGFKALQRTTGRSLYSLNNSGGFRRQFPARDDIGSQVAGIGAGFNADTPAAQIFKRSHMLSRHHARLALGCSRDVRFASSD
jgi:hypothetical protein